MKIKNVIIIGAGGHARVVASILKINGIHVSGFYDDAEELLGCVFSGIPVSGKISELKSDINTSAIIAIGDNERRKHIASTLQFNWINAVHPFSSVSPDADLGKGTVVCAGVIVQPGASIGDHTILNTKASVDHDCIVGDFCHIAVAHLGGGSTIKEGFFVALNSVLLPNTIVGEWATVGAGAVVTKNVDAFQTVIGTPAKPILTSSAYTV